MYGGKTHGKEARISEEVFGGNDRSILIDFIITRSSNTVRNNANSTGCSKNQFQVFDNGKRSEKDFEIKRDKEKSKMEQQ